MYIDGVNILQLTSPSPRTTASPGLARASPRITRQCRTVDYTKYKETIERFFTCSFTTEVKWNQQVIGLMFLDIRGVAHMRSISCTPVLPGKVLCSSCQELTNLITKLQKRRQSAPLLPVEESTQVDDSAVIELAEIQSKVKNPICRWANCAVGKLDTVRDLIEHVRSYHIPTQSGAPHQRSYKCEWEGCTSIPKQKKQLLLNHITDKHTGKY